MTGDQSTGDQPGQRSAAGGLAGDDQGGQPSASAKAPPGGQPPAAGEAPVGLDAPGGAPLRVAYVLGTASGGTARHAGLLAEGCRQAGVSVVAAGPVSSRAAFAAGAASLRRHDVSVPPGNVSGGVPAEAGGAEAGGAGAPGADGAGDVPGGGRSAGAGDGVSPSSADDTAGLPGLGEAAGAWVVGAGAGSGIAYYPVEIGDRPQPGRDIAAVAALRRLLRQARPDVVHAHGLRAGALAALALLARRPATERPGRDSGRLGRRPTLVVTVHNAPPSGQAGAVVYAVLARICARRADVVLCASADLAARMRRYRARVQEFAVPAPPAPPASAADIARARADLGPADRPVVLAVARLAEQKGLDTLLAAAAGWQDRSPRPALAVAGDGPLAGRLASVAADTGVDLTLLGQRDDVPALLAAADVVVVPSRWEARALVVQEAMRAGRPVVASRVGGIPDLTGEDAAILVPPGDAGQLAAAVLAVLADPARAAGLAAAAQRRAAALPGPADAVAAALAIYRSPGAAEIGQPARA